MVLWGGIWEQNKWSRPQIPPPPPDTIVKEFGTSFPLKFENANYAYVYK